MVVAMRRPLRPPRGDVVLACVLASAATAEVVIGELTPYRVSVPLMLVQAGAVAWRRQAPLPALVAATAAMFAQTAAGVSLHSAVTPIVIALILLYSVAQHEVLGRAVIGLVIGLCGSLGAIELAVANGEEYGLADRAFVSVFIVAPWLVGRALYGRTQELADVADRAARLERERATAIADERARIARELHDVIAHSLGVIIVQAGAGETVVEQRPEQAQQVLRSIQRIGREALGEMSRLVGVLRDGGEEVGLAPQPGLGQVDALLEDARAAGLEVELVVEGTPSPVSAGLDLAAYRIVQEALTNVRKHAGGARATVVVGYAPGALELEVCDDGVAAQDAWGGGHGLVGMRERAAVYGGTLEAGPRPEGGFAVRARLPIEEAA